MTKLFNAEQKQTYDKNSWITPPHIIELARRVMGSIDLDPASSARAQEVVKASEWYGLDHPDANNRDGLRFDCSGFLGMTGMCGRLWDTDARTWLNPPYGRGLIEPWIELVQMQREAVVLVNAATGTLWFHTLLEACDALCLTMGRLAFLHPETLKPVKGNNYAQAIFYFGTNVAAFDAAFSEIGAVLRG